MQWTSPTGRTIELREGDITQVAADAIVNAANSSLAGGGGVDGAIHRVGGAAIMRELNGIRARTGGCHTGSAVPTCAGRLPARYVFHTVGPIYRDGQHGEPDLLRSCYRTCLEMAEERGVKTISFPAISTGVYGYPIADAARIAVAEVQQHLSRADSTVERVIFVLFSRGAFEAYAAALQ